jgi:hypothetical protein
MLAHELSHSRGSRVHTLNEVRIRAGVLLAHG